MNGKVINAFGRKEGDPLPGEAEEGKLPVCENSVRLLEEFLRRAKAGEVRGVAIATVCDGYPAFSIAGPGDHDARDFGVLNLALDGLKTQLMDFALDAAEASAIEEDEE